VDVPGAPGCCPDGSPGGEVVDAWPPFGWECGALIVCMLVSQSAAGGWCRLTWLGLV
jgi:hypothetical protein